MATIRDWKLGDAPPPGYRLVRENIALPPSRDAVVKLLGEILAKNVQKVVVEVRKPIEVLRLAKESEVGPMIEDVPSDDLYGMIRNASIEDVSFKPSDSVFDRLMSLFHRVRMAGMEPVGCLIGSARTYMTWIDRVGPADYLMGVPVEEHADVPDDVLILACRLQGEPEGVDQSFKITLDKPEGSK
jgi:hypothetical protein